MTKLQTLQLELGTKTKRQMSLLEKGAAKLTNEEAGELSTLGNEIAGMHPKINAAIEAESGAQVDLQKLFTGATDGLTAEALGLINAAKAGDVFAAVVSNRPTDGATREMQQALGVADNEIPIAAMRVWNVAATAGKPSEVSQTEQPVISILFPGSDAEFAAVSQTVVGSGIQVFPVAGGSDAKGIPTTVAAAANVPDTDITFTPKTLSPLRVQRSATWNIEDAAIFGQLEMAVRSWVQTSMQAGLDYMALRQTDAGIFDAGTDPTASGTTLTYALAKAAAFAEIDGIITRDLAGIRFLTGKETVSLLASVYRNNNSADGAAYDYLQARSGGVRITANAKAETGSNAQEGCWIRPGAGAGAIMPIWAGIQIGVDGNTLATDGQVRLFARALANVAVVRSEIYSRVAYDLS